MTRKDFLKNFAALGIGLPFLSTMMTSCGKEELLSPDFNIDFSGKVLIVGAGAAGLTASIYIQRDRFSSLILEKKNIGGNAFLTQKIENYPGFTEISGPKLMQRMAEQAKVYGAKIETGVEVKNISEKGNLFQIDTNMGEYQSKSVVLALGSTYRKLGITNEEDLIGAGIHFCATCDGAFYRDKEVLVIGGGNSALEEGIFLAGFCKKVTIVNRSATFSASETYIEKLPSIKNIETHLNKASLAFTKDENGNFKGLEVKDKTTGAIEELTADGAFIFIGLIPNTSIIKDTITNPVNVVLKGKVRQSPLLNEVFLVNMKDLDTIAVDLDFSEATRKLDASIKAPHINYAGNELDSLSFNMNTDRDAFTFDLGFDGLTAGPIAIQETRIKGNQTNNELSLDFLAYANDEKLIQVQSDITGSRERLRFHVSEDSLIFNKKDQAL